MPGLCILRVSPANIGITNVTSHEWMSRHADVIGLDNRIGPIDDSGGIDFEQGLHSGVLYVGR